MNCLLSGEIIEESSEKKSNKDIIETLAENEKPISNLIDKVNATIENIANQFFKHNEQKTKFSIRMAIILTFIVSLIVVVTSILTFLGKLTGEALTFLLGLIVGYMLTFIREAIYPPE